MPAKLTTTAKNIEVKAVNHTNRQIIKDFYEYLQNTDSSENYQNGLLKVLISYPHGKRSKSLMAAYANKAVFQLASQTYGG